MNLSRPSSWSWPSRLAEEVRLFTFAPDGLRQGFHDPYLDPRRPGCCICGDPLGRRRHGKRGKAMARAQRAGAFAVAAREAVPGE